MRCGQLNCATGSRWAGSVSPRGREDTHLLALPPQFQHQHETRRSTRRQPTRPCPTISLSSIHPLRTPRAREDVRKSPPVAADTGIVICLSNQPLELQMPCLNGTLVSRHEHDTTSSQAKLIGARSWVGSLDDLSDDVGSDHLCRLNLPLNCVPASSNTTANDDDHESITRPRGQIRCLFDVTVCLQPSWT